MKLVAIDIGTTRIKCGRFVDDVLQETWHYPTKDSGSIGGDLLSKVGKDEIAMSSVAPNAAADLEKTIGRRIFRITPESQNFIKGFRPEYGTDRVADTVAARSLYGMNKNIAVIAMGTCTVLTTVSADGSVGGGFITLGFHTMVSSLKIATPLVEAVQQINFQKFDLDFGYDTNDQILNGSALGQIGIVERWLELCRQKFGESMVSVATGGNSALLTNIGARNSQSISAGTINPNDGPKKIVDYIDPHLTIKGIHIIYKTNTQ